MSAPQWRVNRMSGRFTISHPWIATAPTCPDGPHPTRDCACEVFRTEALATACIAAQRQAART